VTLQECTQAYRVTYQQWASPISRGFGGNTTCHSRQADGFLETERGLYKPSTQAHLRGFLRMLSYEQRRVVAVLVSPSQVDLRCAPILRTRSSLSVSDTSTSREATEAFHSTLNNHGLAGGSTRR
jgi:hypothetical protein